MPALEPGTLLNNRYLIEEVIARGGMGAVYRGRDQSLGIQVAVKENLIPRDLQSRQFQREAVILAGMRHPNLPRVTDHFVIPGEGQYLVMDFIEGEDLRDRITREGHLSEADVFQIAISICDALIFLHNQTPPVIHRDIKPGNIRISPNGQIYLVDFGLAKINKKDSTTTPGAQSLTPGFAPPEQYGQGTDQRSDIYALGATLYAAFTGITPEDGFARIMGSAALTAPHIHNPDIADHMEAILLKMMAIDPKRRYQSVLDVRQAFLWYAEEDKKQNPEGPSIVFPPNLIFPTPDFNKNNYLDNPESSNEPIGITEKLMNREEGAYVKFPRRSNRWLVPASLGFVALALAIFIAINRFWPSNDNLQAINLSSNTVTLSPQVTNTSGLLVSEPTINVAVEKLISPSATQKKIDLTKTTDIKLIQQPSITPSKTNLLIKSKTATATLKPSQTATTLPTKMPIITLQPTETPTMSITPIGGGKGQIAFVSDRGGDSIPQIWLMDADGGNQRQISNINGGACEPSWSPDGISLAFTSPCKKRTNDFLNTSIYVMNMDTKEVKVIPSLPGGDFDPSFSPDGKKIVFSSRRNGQSNIYLYDMQTGKTNDKALSPSIYDRHPVFSPDGKTIAFETGRLQGSQIWMMTINGDSPREFSVLENGRSYMPSWSPDGTTIVFVRGVFELPWLVIKQVGNKLNKEFDITEDTKGKIGYWDPHYSPDGFWLIFESWPDDNHDIYRMDRSGGASIRLTTNPAQDFQPEWRPIVIGK